MSKEFFSRRCLLTTIAAIGLCCSASLALAGGGGLMPGLQVAPGSSVNAVLPAVSNPRPYRQTVFATCDTAVPGLSLTFGCVISLGKISTGHMLQIDNINCGGVNVNATAAFLFNTRTRIDADHLVGPLGGSGVNGVIARGPYYFRQGEMPKFLMAGSAATDRVFCSVAGTFWDTN
jgi:hypothetical protein